MTIDCDGNLYVALWAGRGVIVIDPRSQKLLDRIEVPTDNVTSCCFGGEKMDELFITTARDEKNPGSGGIFRVRRGSRGFAANLFQ
jgi:sugar lactone lactonase YvrE